MSGTQIARDSVSRQARDRLTETTARRLAWGTFALCATLFAASLVFSLLSPSTEAASWGSGGTLGAVAFGTAVSCFPVVGVLITHRQPRSTIGWLLLGIGVVWAWSGFGDGYVAYAFDAGHASLPNPALVAALTTWLWVPAVGLMGTFLILLFPDGHLPSEKWRGVARLSGFTIVLVSLATLFSPGLLEDASVPGLTNPLGLDALTPFMQVLSTLFLLLPASILASAAGLVARFRSSRGVERLQLKGLAAAGAMVAVLYLLAGVATVVDSSSSPSAWVVGVQNAALLSFGLLPVAIGVAILKHRLYGIDVVINKAVVFGALASFITAVYVAIVVGIGNLVGRGGEPNLALSIAATAVVAVAFQPVRDRVQRFANRLVYGARTTPYEVLSNFTDRMGGSYDAADLLPMMARTVAQGIGASHVGIWLGIGSTFVREASWPTATDDTAPVEPASVNDMTDLEGDRIVAVRHHGELLGVITVVKPPGEPVTPAEDKLLNDVAAQAGLVLRNVRLIEELRSSRQRLVTTQDEERRRLERNLHDGAQQNLVSVALLLRTARARLETDGDTLGAALDSASEQLALAIEELRELARGIHPAILTDRGLKPAIESLAERSTVPVIVDYRLAGRPEKSVEGTVYFVVAEALTNVAKYAGASEVRVTVARSSDTLTLEIADDGVGGADRTKGSGLRGLSDRVAVVDGTLDIDSPTGGGTRLTCRIPLTPVARQPDVVPDETPTATPLGAGQ